jgi:menaquinone-dependent protoporphyrinogen IX oxidase
MAEEHGKIEEEKEIPEREEEEEEEETEEDKKLPFPRATIVNMLRKNLSPGKQIKGQVKREMNLWLAKMVERIAAKMDAHPYTYVDGSMLREAVEPYENIQDIEKEKERIIKQLESVKAACDVLINEVDRKFVK